MTTRNGSRGRRNAAGEGEAQNGQEATLRTDASLSTLQEYLQGNSIMRLMLTLKSC